jgi:hypothetical protein
MTAIMHIHLRHSGAAFLQPTLAACRSRRGPLGDFDYNGFVDDDDVTLLGAFYDPSAASLVVADPSGANVAAVPEPTSALLVATALLGLGIVPLIRRAKFFRRRST